MLKSRLKGLGWVAAGALACGMAPGLAQADDGKMYPAIACQPALDGTPSTLEYQGIKLVNTSPSYSVVVACPIVKDDVFSSSGSNDALVRFKKASSTGFLGDLHSFSAWGTGHHVSYKSDFSGAGYKTMTFAALPGFSQGYYVMLLVLPPKAEVFSYRLDEN